MNKDTTVCDSYSFNSNLYINENIKLLNKNLSRKLYLYDNFYEDNSQIIALFKLDSNNCKNTRINEVKCVYEHILSKSIKTLESNIIKLTDDHVIKTDDNEWIAVIFLNSNNPFSNGLAFMQENFNSNNMIKHSDIMSTQMIVEDFFYGKPNRIILFNSKYYHKLIVKTPVIVEIIRVKLL
jgi:hypothetical protein